MQLFARLTKVDEAHRRVTGVAILERPDYDNEIFDYAGSKPYFVAMADMMSKASGGKNLMPVRANHTTKAAGHVIQMDFNDETKEIPIVAEIDDDQEWRKVLSGTYTGFSVDGRYIRRWADPKNPSLRRYIARPISIDLADVPCIPGAYLDLVKSDGASEKLQLVGNPEQPQGDPRDSVHQFWSCKTTAHEHFEKDDAMSCVKSFGIKKDESVAGDGEIKQEDEMDEKDLAKIQQAVTSGNEDLKKSFGAQIDDVKKSVGAMVDEAVTKAFGAQKEADDKRFEGIEEGIETLSKAFLAFGEQPESEQPPMAKAIPRSKDTGDAPDDEGDEGDEGDVKKSKPSALSAIKQAFKNPTVVNFH